MHFKKLASYAKDSPRSDFKLNDIMGGIVIRIPLTGG